MRRTYLLSLAFALAIACTPGPKNDSSRAQSIEAQVWSPYCPGRLLIDCTTRQARELRTEIAQRVESGQGTDEVLAWVRDEFGDAALARPSAGPAGLVIWLVPAVLFLAGGVFLTILVRRWTGREEQHPAVER